MSRLIAVPNKIIIKLFINEVDFKEMIIIPLFLFITTFTAVTYLLLLGSKYPPVESIVPY